MELSVSVEDVESDLGIPKLLTLSQELLGFWILWLRVEQGEYKVLKDCIHLWIKVNELTGSSKELNSNVRPKFQHFSQFPLWILDHV